ncbi:unnamed protein product [Oikopleura dioica]|uniref:Uncharacterized protein n=1 Tax=Oikopleura dioica TaxID=34765 RepID=E4YFC2_OIKDI|nr:unnamed protein product [Oikopleura dioica]
MKARRIFVVAISKFNKMIKWFDALPESRQIEVIELALVERAENERISKQLMKDDLRKLTGIVADNNEEIPNAQELVEEENEEETDESEEEEEENEQIAAEVDQIEDVLNAIPDYEKSA